MWRYALVAVLVVILFWMIFPGSSRESLQFVIYTDPIFPDGAIYETQYWPRTGGQLGQNIFSGWPQYFKAY